MAAASTAPFRVTALAEAARTLLSTEPRWRRALAAQAAAQRHDVLLHVGCGGGELITLLAQAAPGAVVMGLDPNAAALVRARARAAAVGVRVELIQGSGEDIASYVCEWAPNKILYTLNVHEAAPRDWRRTLAAAHAAMRTGGELHLAAFSLPGAGPLAQRLLGGPAANPAAPSLTDQMRAAGFSGVHETQRFTAAGSVTRLYRARA